MSVKKMMALLTAEPSERVPGLPDMGDVYHVVAEFVCYNSKNERIIVRLLDGGPDFRVPEYRYSVEAHIEGKPRRRATGNGGATPELALEDVSWNELEHDSPYP